ncbi:hypothetical protein Tco_0913536 [Tanacetum coccineum]
MKDELDSINRNNTPWRIKTSLPPGHKAIGLKWVFKTKRDADGKIIKHKARWKLIVVLCRNQGQAHMEAHKESTTLLYKEQRDYGITYKIYRGNKIYGYSDSSYGVNTQEGKGTTGIIFYYGESPISWSTQKQATIALSSCEFRISSQQTAKQASKAYG